MKRVAKLHVKKVAKVHARNRHNVDSVKAAMDNVGTTYAEIHNASINNAEIYNVVGLKVEIVKMR